MKNLLLLGLCSSLTVLAVAEEVPGSAHSAVREHLSSGDAAGAIAALEPILETTPGNAEALVLRGAAQEATGELADAWGSYDAGLVQLRTVGTIDQADLGAFAVEGKARANGMRVEIAAARATATAALEKAMTDAKSAGDVEISRQAAVAILRLDPAHAVARQALADYRRNPAMAGAWIDLFDPSLSVGEKPEGDWEPLVDADGYVMRPNGELVDTAELLLPVDAPKDGYEFEATFEIIEMNSSQARTVSLGFGRGVGCHLALAIIADSRITVCKQAGTTLEPIGDSMPAALPSEGREFAMRLRVVGGELTVMIEGSEVGKREGVGPDLEGLPLQIATQNTATRVTNIRFRTYEPGDAPADAKALKLLAKLVKKKDADCLDEADTLLADHPNDVELLHLRADAAAALGQTLDALITYDRVLDEATDKKLLKTVEKERKKLTFDAGVDEILAAYDKAVDGAERAAPRAFEADKLRALQVRRQVLPLEKGDLKTYEKLVGDAKAEVEWLEVPLTGSERCRTIAGEWRAVGEELEVLAKSRELSHLQVPCVVSDSFELSVDMRMLMKSKVESTVQLCVGDPLIAWVHAYPDQRYGVMGDADSESKKFHAIAKKRRTADDEWHTISVRVDNGMSVYSIDGERIFQSSLPEGFERLGGRLVRLRTGPGPIRIKNLRYRDLW